MKIFNRLLILILLNTYFVTDIDAQTNRKDILFNIGAYSGYGYPNGLRSTETSGIPAMNVGAEYFLTKVFAIGPYVTYTYAFDKFVGTTDRYKDMWRGWDLGLKTSFHFNSLLSPQNSRKRIDPYLSGFAGYTYRALRYDKSNIYRDSLNYSVDAFNIGSILGFRYVINRKFGLYGELGKSRDWFIGAGVNITLN